MDIETGIVTINEMVAAQDCGLVIDLKTAESQVYGALIMGIAPNIPGFLGTIKVVDPATVGPFLMNLYNYAWFVGFAVAFFAYGGFMTVLGKIKPVRA